MITISGEILNVIKKQPYKNKQGEMVTTYDIDVKSEAERYFQTVSINEIEQNERDYSVGDEVSFIVSQFLPPFLRTHELCRFTRLLSRPSANHLCPIHRAFCLSAYQKTSWHMSLVDTMQFLVWCAGLGSIAGTVWSLFFYFGKI